MNGLDIVMQLVTSAHIMIAIASVRRMFRVCNEQEEHIAAMYGPNMKLLIGPDDKLDKIQISRR